MFADSSAVVKLYAAEAGSESMQGITTLAVSTLTRVEVPAAIWKKVRSGEMSADRGRILQSEFESDLFGLDGRRAWTVTAPDSAILERATVLVALEGLRAYDAIQLATAIAVREADPTCGVFACFDAELSRVAASHGFEILPGE